MKRIFRLGEALGKVYEANGPWGETCRLDIVVQHPVLDGAVKIISRLISETAERHKAGAVKGETVDGVVFCQVVSDDRPAPRLCRSGIVWVV